MKSKRPKDSTKPSKQQAVTIFVGTEFAQVRPALTSVLGPHLESVERFPVVGGPFGTTEVTDLERFYSELNPRRLVTLPGLVPRIKTLLVERGYCVTVKNIAIFEVLRNANSELLADERLTDDERSVVTVVASQPRGQILVPKSTDVPRLLALLSCLFDTHNVLVVAWTRQKAKKVFQEMKQHFVGDIYLEPDIAWRKPMVVIADHTMYASASPDDWDVILFTDPACVTAHESFKCSLTWRTPLRYCCTTNGGENDLSALRLEAICGPIIHRFGEASKTQRQVRVEMVDTLAAGSHPQKPVASRPASQKGARPAGTGKFEDDAVCRALEEKRTRIWHNRDRNVAIAELLKALAAKRLGNQQAYATVARKLKGQMKSPSVAVLVASTEHGQELKSLLPTWRLVALQAGEDGTIEDPGNLHQAIVTEAFAASYRLGVNILVRGTGGSTALRLAGLEKKPEQPWPREVCIVDLQDDFDSQAVKDTKNRVKDYRRRGWLS